MTDELIELPANELIAQGQEAMIPGQLLSTVVTQGADLDKISALMDLFERNEKRLARMAYVVAMAMFKKNPPIIVKDSNVCYVTNKGKTEYSHASSGQVSQKINSALSEHGLTASWAIDQSGQGIKVTCSITHTSGHSESTSIEAPPDNSGGKNAIQAIGSSITYLQRYSILALTGLSTSENDDDGAAAGYSDDHIQNVKISAEDFIGGIDFFKKPDKNADNLDAWFESKSEAFRMLPKKDRATVTEHLRNTFDWLDERGKHGNSLDEENESKLELNI